MGALAGTPYVVAGGSASLAGTGALAPSGRLVVSGAGALAGAGQIAFSAGLIRKGFADLGGIGLMAASGDAFTSLDPMDPGAYADVTVTAGPRASVTVSGFGGLSQSDRPSATVTVVKTTADVERG